MASSEAAKAAQRRYYQKHRERYLEYSHTRIRKKYFGLESNPRTGECSYCRQRPGWTGIFHRSIMESNEPLKHSIELCHSCAAMLRYTGGGCFIYPPSKHS